MVNLLLDKKKLDNTLIIISLQFDNIEVNREEFFSLLVNKHTINPAQKAQLIKSVIEKCGLTYEGTLRDYFRMPDGSFESRMYFSILKDE